MSSVDGSMNRTIVAALFVVAATVACPSGNEPSEEGDLATFQDINAFYGAIRGDWQGPYDLWLMPNAPKESSESTAAIEVDATGNSWVMNYQWSRDGTAHQGVFHFLGSDKAAEFTWSDSFHSAPKATTGIGTLSDDGTKLVFMSSYSGGPGTPDWGWRTEFTYVDGDTLKMEAYNITPQGEEALAVRCEYSRQ